MTQDEKWFEKYNGVKDFIEKYHRNPSKHIDEERGLYLNWIKHNRKQLNAGTLKAERVDMFKELLEIIVKYKHVNQYA